MGTQLSGKHQKVYQHLFQHPIPHNLEWREVWAMLSAIPGIEAVEEENGNLRVSRNGQVQVLHRPRHKDLADEQEVMQIRHFLDRSAAAAPAAAPAGTHLLVVIDHREARIYRTEMQGAVPKRIEPYDPFGFGRALHNDETDGDGRRKPEQRSFYEAVAKTLAGAEKILLFGTATGASSAMEQLLADLQKHHRDLAARVAGSIAIDEHHLTDDQLLAKARQFFAGSNTPAL
jgi:hypothetical protein